MASKEAATAEVPRVAGPESGPSSPASETSQVFFTSGASLVEEPRTVSADHPARDAVESLLQGPAAPDHYSEIPPATQLLSIDKEGEVAYVSLSRAFFAPTGSTGAVLRLAQVVFTLTQFASIHWVQILNEGQKQDILGGEGFPLGRPLSRSDFRGLA